METLNGRDRPPRDLPQTLIDTITSRWLFAASGAAEDGRPPL